MSYIHYNPNPSGRTTGDCVIRAISKLMDQSWQDTYLDLTVQGLVDGDWGNSNYVWGNYLKKKGYTKALLPDTCPNCYNVSAFCHDHPEGRYLLATGEHVVAVIDGDYYDSWDSGIENPIYYWKKAY